MYYTPDGKSAVIVAEAMKRIDFREPKTMALQASVSALQCGGINHGDFSIDGQYLTMTCESARAPRGVRLARPHGARVLDAAPTMAFYDGTSYKLIAAVDFQDDADKDSTIHPSVTRTPPAAVAPSTPLEPTAFRRRALGSASARRPVGSELAR